MKIILWKNNIKISYGEYYKKVIIRIYYGNMMKHGLGNKTLLIGRLEFKLTVFWVHKDMSNSYREGTAQKLKSMAQPYKTKVWQKS